MTIQYVRVGIIKKKHGHKGLLHVQLHNSNALRFDSIHSLYIGNKADNLKKIGVNIVKHIHKGILVQPVEPVDQEDTHHLINKPVWLMHNQLKTTAKDTYYHFQLEGLNVSTTEGQHLGVLVEIMQTGANDVYVIRNQTVEYLIPAIKSVVKTVDLDRNIMIIEPMRDMLETDV